MKPAEETGKPSIKWVDAGSSKHCLKLTLKLTFLQPECCSVPWSGYLILAGPHIDNAFPLSLMASVTLRRGQGSTKMSSQRNKRVFTFHEALIRPFFQAVIGMNAETDSPTSATSDFRVLAPELVSNSGPSCQERRPPSLQTFAFSPVYAPMICAPNGGESGIERHVISHIYS